MKHVFMIPVALLLAGCPKDIDVRKVSDSVSKLSESSREQTDEEEIEIGTAIAARLVGAAPLVRNDHVQRYVNQVGRWVAQQSERTELPWRFAVLDSADLNAFAIPGGFVFITQGLLESMQNEAELAGVLGHEISHVLRQHHLRAIRKQNRIGAATDLVSSFIGDKKDQKVFDKLVGAGTQLYARGLDKDDELEADRMGVVLAARAGYDPYGLPAVLQTIQAKSTQDPALALMLKTHPAPGARLDLLEKVMPKALERYAGQPAVAARFVREVSATP